MKKRLFTIFLTIGLLILLLPVSAMAVPATSVVVGGVELTVSDTPVYATTDENGTVTLKQDFTEEDPWNIKFEEGVLTLNHATITDITTMTSQNFGIFADESLNLVLIGQNTITLEGKDDNFNYISGVTIDDDLNITGTGSAPAALTINISCATLYDSKGINALGYLHIKDCTIQTSGYGESDGIYAGIIAEDDLVIENSTVEATGTGENGYGIYSRYEAIRIDGNSYVTATSETAGKAVSSLLYVNDVAYTPAANATKFETKYGVVTGAEIATQEALYVNGIGILTATDQTVECGDGTAVYDAATNTLTLDNATITKAKKFNNDGDGSYIYSENKLNLVLKGENTITATENSDTDYGIFTENYLAISGGGSLSIEMAGEDVCGIYTSKDLTISDNSSLSITTTGENSCGISLDKDLIISDNSFLSITTTGEMSCGLYPAYITVTDNSFLSITTTGESSYGIDAISMTVTDSTVIAEGGEYGIVAISMTVTDSTVTAEGGDLGIRIDVGDFTLSDSTLTAKGGDAALMVIVYSGSTEDTAEDFIRLPEGCLPEGYELQTAVNHEEELSYYSIVKNGESLEIDEHGAPIGAVKEITLNDRQTGATTYPPVITDSKNGAVTVFPSDPLENQQVTITAKPNNGYEIADVTVTDEGGNKIQATDNGDGTWNFIQPDSAVTITVTFREIESVSDCPGDETCPMAKFTDLELKAWYHDGIHYCIEKDLMNGMEATVFAPNSTTTRAQIVTILYRLEGEPEVAKDTIFEDMEEGAWYTKAISWAAEENIVEGYGDGTFGPDDAITREQLATILYRYAQYKGYDVSTGEEDDILSFVDVGEVSEWAASALQWSCGAGIINGTDGNRLDPQGNATRAQAAAMLQRFCDHTEG